VRSFLAKESSTDFARAFATILRNRVQRGGILAPGASFIKNGENGKGIRSRWYPETLRKRIEAILHIRSNIAFIKGDVLNSFVITVVGQTLPFLSILPIP